MKSSSTTGLAYSFIPGDTAPQSTSVLVNAFANDIIKPNNNFYLFEGQMPSPETLATYTSGTVLATDYNAKLILKIQNIDIKYTFDKETRTRKIQKFPVNAQSIASLVDGTAGWACIELNSIAISSPYKSLIFTDAVGGWDDPEQSILVSSTNVVAGENIVVKDINITLRDARVIDLA